MKTEMAWALVALLLPATGSVAQSTTQSPLVPQPEGRTPEVVDYRKPERYLEIHKSVGDPALVRRLAKDLKAKDPEQTIRNVHAYIASQVPQIPPSSSWPKEHKNFTQLNVGFDHSNCASHGLLFANLLRACSIPTVYIKSMRHEWIRSFVKTGKTGTISGHVFLEVHLRRKWRLLDAQAMRVWDDYDAGQPELPGGLLAYEKGSDHFKMVHSTRRDLFIRETRKRFAGFDVAKLRPNDAAGRLLLPRVYALTLAKEWKVLNQRISNLRSFDRPHWQKKKGEVQGNILIVTSMGGRCGLPESEAEAWLPITQSRLSECFQKGKTSTHRFRRADGTLVVLLAAPRWPELLQLIRATDFEKIRAQFARK